MAATIYLDESCVGTVVREQGPYVKLLTVPKWEDGRLVAVARVDGTLAVIELRATKAETQHQ